MTSELTIRRAGENDAERLADLYNWYVANTHITFECEPVSTGEMKQRIANTVANHDWLVGERNNQIVGYAYYGAFRLRAAYSQTSESTIYLSNEAKGKGFGRKLYSALLETASAKGIREIVGVIALPNPASEALHAGMGFRRAGVLERVGLKFGAYHDIALWQRSLQDPLSAQ